MALMLKLDPSGVETGVARGKSALDQIVDSAARAEASLDRVGATSLAPLGQSASVAKSAIDAFANESAADLLRFDTTIRGASTAVTAAMAGISGATQGVSADFARMAGISATTAADMDRIAQEATQASAAYNQLRASIDPLYAAELRLESAQQQVNRAIDAGVINAHEAAAAMRMAEASYGRATSGARGAASAIDTAGRASGAMRSQFQNASFQIADFAVQVGGGTSAVRAFSQQLPQLLGGFGLWGAAIGAVVAIGGALAPMLFKTGDAAKEADDHIDALTDALSGYIEYAKTATSSTATLEGEFGRFAEQIRQHAQFLANVQVANATRELANDATTFSVALDKVSAAQKIATDASRLYFQTLADQHLDPSVAESYFEAYKEVMDGAKNAAAAIGLTELQATNLKTALDALSTDNGGGLAEIHSDAAAVNSLLIDMTANGQKISPELAALAEKMFDLEKSTATSLDLQGQMPGALNSATSAANGLHAAMGGVAAAAWDALLSFNAMATAQLRSSVSPLTGPAGMGSSPPTGGAVGTSPRPGRRGVDSLTFGASSGGGGGGADPFAATQKAYDSLMASLDPAISASQKLAKAQKTINAELATGAITTAQAAAATKLATAEYDKSIASINGVAGAWDDLNSTGADAFDSLIDGTKTLSEALQDMAKDLMFATVKAQLLQHVTGGTEGMGFGALILQGITGGFHDGGGTIPSGTTGMVGERGPELVRATSSGAVVTSRADTARMMQPQVMQVQIGVTVDDDGKVQAYVRKAGQAAAQSGATQAVQAVKKSLPTWNSQLATEGAL